MYQVVFLANFDFMLIELYIELQLIDTFDGWRRTCGVQRGQRDGRSKSCLKQGNNSW